MYRKKGDSLNILFLTCYLPYPPVTGIKLRVLQHLELLHNKHDIFLISFYWKNEELTFTDDLKRYCKGIFLVKMPKLHSYFGIIKSLLKGEPIQCGLYGYSPYINRHLYELIKQKRIDLIYVSLLRMAPYISSGLKIPAILDYCDALSLQTKRRAMNETIFNWKKPLYYIESKLLQRYEKKIKPLFGTTLVTSLEDAIYIDADAPPMIVPNYYKIKESEINSNQEPFTLGFSGDMAGTDNVNAIKFFCKKIFPFILAKYPQCRFYIIGANPSKKIFDVIQGLKNNIIVTGYVNDLESILSRIQVYVCPLMTGTGIKNRILQAMGLKMPIVSTSWGNKGVDAMPDRDIIITDDINEFADKVMLLFNNPSLRKELGENAQVFVKEKFSQERIKKLLNAAIEMTFVK